ncbi:MAG: amidohydrolase family protein [Bacillota bacterium]
MPTPKGRLFLTNCRVVDGTGSPAIERATVIVDRLSGNIIYVGPDNVLDMPFPGQNDEVLDINGYTVMPGLFNVHTHLGLKLPFTPYKLDPYTEGYWALICYRRAVEAMLCGATSLRCPGGPHGADIAVRNAIDKMMVWGPRLIVAGRLMLAHGGHGYNSVGTVECSGVPQFREAARIQLREGADLLKICLSGGLGTPGEGFTDKQMTDDEVSAVVEVAHMSGKRVAAHVGGDKPIQDAVRLGVDCIEHGYVLSEETAGIMAEAGTYLVPTLAVTHAFSYLEAHGSPSFQVEKARQASHFHKDSITRAIKAGVKIAVGTDLLPSDPLDGTNATVREVELLVEAGMAPLEAIKAATLTSAELCQVDDVTGSLAMGKQADLIAVCGKPDETISDLRNLSLVARAGHVVFSKVPGCEGESLRILPEGFAVEGGTFKNW